MIVTHLGEIRCTGYMFGKLGFIITRGLKWFDLIVRI